MKLLERPDFRALPCRHGLLVSLADSDFPTAVYGIGAGVLALPAGDTHFGMITAGAAWLRTGEDAFRLRAGMYFAVPGPAAVEAEGADGQGLVVSRLGYRGLFQIGGPVEAAGRLQYIDGCTDTLLVCPPRRGDPCLNHLHLPAGTLQSSHVHPSDRIGVILSGQGVCDTESGPTALAPGMAWHIPAGTLHRFRTAEHSLDVLAWHPDSDFGPTDENHPMRNRTYVRAGTSQGVV